MSSTKVQWRVQVRKSRAHKWVNKGLFETRRGARHEAFLCREGMGNRPYYRFGNTRVVRYEKGAKARVRAM